MGLVTINAIFSVSSSKSVTINEEISKRCARTGDITPRNITQATTCYYREIEQ